MGNTTPLRITQLAGYPLRIYASPMTVADYPWASFHDLMTLAEMDEADQPRWLDKLRQELPDTVLAPGPEHVLMSVRS